MTADTMKVRCAALYYHAKSFAVTTASTSAKPAVFSENSTVEIAEDAWLPVAIFGHRLPDLLSADAGIRTYTRRKNDQSRQSSCPRTQHRIATYLRHAASSLDRDTAVVVRSHLCAAQHIDKLLAGLVPCTRNRPFR